MADPRWVTAVPEDDRARGDGDWYADFIEASCRVTKESIGGRAGELLTLRPWQRRLNSDLFARRPDGRYRHRQALIGVPRKNGKSGLGAGWSLAALFLGPVGGEVYCCAGEKEQARIVFGVAKQMIDMDPDLSRLAKSYRDVIEVPSTGAILRVLSAEAYSKEGLNPTTVVFDELHVQPNRELWDVMSLAMGARVEPMLIGITTAGVRYDTTGADSLCFQMYEYGKRVASGDVDDPAFYFAWWEPSEPDADWRSESVWEQANPGYGDLVSAEDFASSAKRTPENEYRTKRLNQWVSSSTAWLPAGAWDACGDDDGAIPDGADVVLGFDGSFNNDSTALVVVACGDVPRIGVVDAWEKADTDDPNWQVPILDVEDAIRKACRRWQVREIVCDPFRWARTYQILEDEGLPIVEFPQSPPRMIPATQRFFEAVMQGQITHDKDARLTRHLGNCTLKTDARGSRLSKESKASNRKIDLAVAAVMALDRAKSHKSSQAGFFSWADL